MANQNDEWAMREAIFDAISDEIAEYAKLKVAYPGLEENADFINIYHYLQNLRNNIRNYKTAVSIADIQKILNTAHSARNNLEKECTINH